MVVVTQVSGNSLTNSKVAEILTVLRVKTILKKKNK